MTVFCILTSKPTAVSIIKHNFSFLFHNAILCASFGVVFIFMSHQISFFLIFPMQTSVLYIIFATLLCLIVRYIELLFLQHDDIICCTVSFSSRHSLQRRLMCLLYDLLLLRLFVFIFSSCIA